VKVEGIGVINLLLEFHLIQQTFRLEFIGGKQHIHFALMVPVVRQRRKNLPKRQLRMLLQQPCRVQTPLEMNSAPRTSP
jgi:hypothetical protein